MKIIAPPPAPIFRDYRTGGDNGLPVTLPFTSRTPAELGITSWIYVQFSPNGGDLVGNIYLTSGPTPTVEDVAVINLLSEGDGLGTLKYLSLKVRRKPGSTGTIAAQTIYLRCTPEPPCVVDAALNTFTRISHGLRDGDAVQIAASALPTGVSAATYYYVRDATPNTFKLAATPGGAAIDPSTAGSSVRFIPGPVEVGRIQVLAAAAGDEPVADYIELIRVNGDSRWTDSATHPVTIHFESSDADLECILEAAGDN